MYANSLIIWLPPGSYRTSHKELVQIISCFWIIIPSHVLIHGICLVLLPSFFRFLISDFTDYYKTRETSKAFCHCRFLLPAVQKKVVCYIIATLLQGPSYLQRDLSEPCKEWAIYRAGIARNVPDENEGQNLWTKRVKKTVKAWIRNESIMRFVQVKVTAWRQE